MFRTLLSRLGLAPRKRPCARRPTRACPLRLERLEEREVLSTATLTATALGGNHQTIYAPAFSPDGSHLDYLAYDSGVGFRVFEDGRAVGGNHETIYGVTFSPDGRHLAFLAGDTGVGFRIFEDGAAVGGTHG